MSGSQMAALRDALLDAFDPDSFDQLLRLRLDKVRVNIARDERFDTVIFRVIEAAIKEGWDRDLINAACEERPGNRALQDYRRE